MSWFRETGFAARARGALSGPPPPFVGPNERSDPVRRATKVHVLLAAVLAAGVAGCYKKGGTAQTGGPSTSMEGLSGAGSSFVKPIMERWVEEYAKAKGGKVNYQAQGSTAGIKAMIEKSVDFGATDAYLSTGQLNEARDAKGGGVVVHVPLVMGGIVPAYNLEGLKEPLNFTGEVLADIYLGKIKKWNDARIKEINAGVDLPDKEIAVCYRSDGSGSTNIFTDYLCKVSAEFKKDVGSGTKVKWPVGGGENGTSGVAGFVKKTDNSIGYVELTYAIQNNIPYGKVKNKAGKFVAASLDSVREAAAQTFKEKEPPEDLRFSITDAPGEKSYPLAGTTWAVCYASQPAGTATSLVGFFSWVIHDGQKYASGLHYAPLPDELVKKIDAKLKTIHAGP
jgi:phosphate ABC transporter phosphate-binding protein